jgi:molecular chaperone DnaK
MALGIDFGTSNSVMAYHQDGKTEIIPNHEGERITPSLVVPNPLLVGGAAKDGIRSIKRILGRSIEENRYFPHPIQEEEDGSLRIIWHDRLFSPEEIAASVLAKMRFDAENYLGEEINEAVITVPAYYNNAQREATKVAAEIAGIRVLRLLNEPTAAALAYGIDEGDETLLVVDLGGGTFDVSLLSLNDGFFEVLATHGDSLLGGDDFTNALRATIPVRELVDENSFFKIVEEAKHELSGMKETEVSFLSKDGENIRHTVTRKSFDEAIEPLLERIIGPIETVLASAGVSKGEITKLLFVGGSTRIPAVRKRVEDFLSLEAVVGVNPEEVVALGAALQASILLGAQDDVLLVDVLPLSLGVETHDGRMSVLLPANITIPAQETAIFTTAEDNQASVEVSVLQGESLLAEGNKNLAELRLLGIPPTLAGVPQIEVNFSFDTDGILHVNARDLATNTEQMLSIEGTSALDENEILRLKEEAKKRRGEELNISLQRSEKAKAERLLSAGRQILKRDGLLNTTYIALQDSLNNLEEEIEAGAIENLLAAQEAIRLAEEEINSLYLDSSEEGQ